MLALVDFGNFVFGPDPITELIVGAWVLGFSLGIVSTALTAMRRR